MPRHWAQVGVCPLSFRRFFLSRWRSQNSMAYCFRVCNCLFLLMFVFFNIFICFVCVVVRVYVCVCVYVYILIVCLNDCGFVCM